MKKNFEQIKNDFETFLGFTIIEIDPNLPKAPNGATQSNFKNYNLLDSDGNTIAKNLSFKDLKAYLFTMRFGGKKSLDKN